MVKLLRQSIRKILLENQAHYDKLAGLICTEKRESIEQAIELAETMGYIDNVKRSWARGYSSHTLHWDFDILDKAFEDALTDTFEQGRGRHEGFVRDFGLEWWAPTPYRPKGKLKLSDDYTNYDPDDYLEFS